jgi:hypothetical protein
MTDKNVIFWSTFLGPLIGLGGLIYGIIKDIQLRRVMSRANAPHFVFKCFLLDFSSAATGAGGHWVYNYPSIPHKLGTQLPNG